MDDYESLLAELVKASPLGDPARRVDYARLLPLVSQAVLDEGHSRQPAALDLMSGALRGRNVVARPTPKKFERYEAKRNERKVQDEPFKAICDFGAIRIIERDLQRFTAIRTSLTELVNGERGQWGDRDGGGAGYQDGWPDHIADYLYLYFPKCRHVIEVQILHPFAARAFHENSVGRDDRRHVSLFRGTGFYAEAEAEIIRYQREGRRRGEELYHRLQAHYREAGRRGSEVSDEIRDSLRTL